MDNLTAEIVADARWFPLRYDARDDQLCFAWVPAEVHHALTFLSDLDPERLDRRFLARSAIAACPAMEAPLHLILHSGLGGSTLMARALRQEGVVTTLKEPPILTDVIAHGLQDRPRGATDRLRDDVARLLARPLLPGEAVVIKMSSIGNGMVAGIAANRPTSRILCLHTPLEAMLASLAAKGVAGREGAGRLFIGMRNARLTDPQFSEADEAQHSDLHLAAIAWLAIQRMMAEAAAEFGPARVRSVDSEQFIARPGETLTAVAAHFQMPLNVDARLASGVFDRHAKTGQQFSATVRANQIAESLRVHGAEIKPIVAWARRGAAAADIPWDPPHPLT